MKKRWIKASAFLLACVLAIGMTGCANTLWVMKTNTITVPTGVYLYYLLTEKSNAQSKMSSSASASSSTFNWSKKIDGKDAKTWVVDQATKDTRELLAAESLCAQKKIALSADEKSQVTSYAQNMMSSYTVLANNGIAQSSLERALAYSEYLKDKLFNSYYAAGGSEAVSDADLKDHYIKNFVQIKQIFFNTNDDSGAALPTAQQQAKQKKANDVLGQISADRSNFNTLMTANNEDPGMQSNPDGYVFGKSQDFVQVFKDASFSMKVGDVKLIKSSMGYHILYKVALDPSKFDSVKSDVLTDMKDPAFLKMLDNYKGITTNNSTINRYNPKNLKNS
ncbi:MAG: peptidylprolyl isomerase [Ethanoligenens sp.]